MTAFGALSTSVSGNVHAFFALCVFSRSHPQAVSPAMPPNFPCHACLAGIWHWIAFCVCKIALTPCLCYLAADVEPPEPQITPSEYFGWTLDEPAQRKTLLPQ